MGGRRASDKSVYRRYFRSLASRVTCIALQTPENGFLHANHSTTKEQVLLRAKVSNVCVLSFPVLRKTVRPKI